MNRRKLKQLARARAIYGKPEKQTNYWDKLNSQLNIIAEMANLPYQTEINYAVHRSAEKSHRFKLAVTGSFCSRETLERIAGYDGTY